ncbi:hypothetical protein GQ42DRAFT_145575 [Ramicandelaber brevisporus]|nr:hypothetical protein GQ42DRAFT_145575 [Ramicandelaber brevisporus]
MRAKRAKQYKKCMQLYTTTFGFREPYQVLLDPQFIFHAQKSKLNLYNLLPATLQGAVKMMVTPCVITELKSMGPEAHVAFNMALRMERRRCNHHDSGKVDGVNGASKNATLPTSNKHRYCVATQNQSLRSRLRLVPGVPLLYIQRSVLILEPASSASINFKRRIEMAKTRATKEELQKLEAVNPTAMEPVRKRAKKAKGPNPLSVKKKQPKKMPQQQKQQQQQQQQKNENVRAGEKRKRDDTASAAAGATSGGDNGEAKKRKRKRSKKTKASTGEGVTVAATE